MFLISFDKNFSMFWHNFWQIDDIVELIVFSLCGLLFPVVLDQNLTLSHKPLNILHSNSFNGLNEGIWEFFHCDLPVFPLVLTETLAECTLIQLSFSYCFFFSAEIYKLEIFINLPFTKISTRVIFKTFPFAKISTRVMRFF